MNTKLFHRASAATQRPTSRHSNLTHQSPRLPIFASWILPLLLLTFPAAVEAQFNFTTNNGTITITRSFVSGAVTIPDTLDGLPVISIGDEAFSSLQGLTSVTIGTNVTSIGFGAFSDCYSLISVTIPDSVTSIGAHAFYVCTDLSSVTIPRGVTNLGGAAFSVCTKLAGAYFKGNAPSIDYGNAFSGANNATVYYLPGTRDWASTFGGAPTVLWNPQVQTTDPSFGVRTNQFGFTITGTSNLVIVVEGCTNLANPTWSAVGTDTLTGGSSFFNDPRWTNYPTRFYRLRWP